MKKTIKILTIIIGSLLTLISCQKGKAYENPAVSLSFLSSSSTSVTFTIQATNFESIAYIIKMADDLAPKSSEIYEQGVIISDLTNPIISTDLVKLTDYIVYVIAKGNNCYSQIEKLAFSTIDDIIPDDFIINLEVINTTKTELSVDIRPTHSSVRYIIQYISEEERSKNNLDTDDKLHDYTLEKLIKDNPNNDIKELLAKITKSGDSELIIEELEEDKEYCIYAYAINENGEKKSKIFKIFGKTEAGFFKMKTAKISTFTIDLSITPKDKNAKYVWICEPKSSYPGASTIDEVINIYIGLNGFLLDMGIGLYAGEQIVPNYKIKPESEYYFYAFKYESGKYSEAKLIEFESDKLGNIEDVKYEVCFLNETSTDCKIKVTPNLNNVYYAVVPINSNEYTDETVSIEKNKFQDNLKELLKKRQEFVPSTTMVDILSMECFSLESEVPFYNLVVGTTYKIIVFGVNSDGIVSKNTHIEDKLLTIK